MADVHRMLDSLSPSQRTMLLDALKAVYTEIREDLDSGLPYFEIIAAIVDDSAFFEQHKAADDLLQDLIYRHGYKSVFAQLARACTTYFYTHNR